MAKGGENGGSAKNAKAARLAEALRENLKRRKAQTRARKAAVDEPNRPDPPPDGSKRGH